MGPRHPSCQQLRQLSRRRTARDELGRFVIDGPVLLAEALRAGVRVRDVFVEPGADELEPVARAARAGARVLPLREGVLAGLTDTVSPQPVAAIADRPEVPLATAVAAAATGLSLVLAGVTDPGNAGTLLRAAEGAGARAVLFTAGAVDPCNPKCVRASAGALFHVDVAHGGETNEVLDRLAAAGIRTAASVVSNGIPYDRADLGGSVALVLGSEAHGLPDEVSARADLALTIPMTGRSESLNVAMAGSIVAFESLRQRRAAAEELPPRAGERR